MTASATGVRPIQTVALSLFRFDRTRDRLWVLGMMGAARPALMRTPGLRFWKLCGAGSGAGFTFRLNMEVCAILSVWEDEDAAREGTRSGVFARYRRRATEDWSVFLAPTSARGKWSGRVPFEPAEEQRPGPLAALTRATIRPSRLMRFWDKVPAINDIIGQDPNVVFKIGLGEVPYLHQATFSVWPDTASMADFARRDGLHARAIRAVRDGDWFSEEFYARFRVLGDAGSWNGERPLERLKDLAA